MPTNTVKSTSDLRTLLVETIIGVRDGSIEPDKARTIASLSGTILSSAKLDLDYLKLRHQMRDDPSAESEMPLVPSRARLAALPAPKGNPKIDDDLPVDDEEWQEEPVPSPKKPEPSKPKANVKAILKSANAIADIRRCIFENGPASKSAIASATGLNIGQVSKLITDNLGEVFKAVGNGTTYDLQDA